MVDSCCIPIVNLVNKLSLSKNIGGLPLRTPLRNPEAILFLLVSNKTFLTSPLIYSFTPRYYETINSACDI